MPAKEVLPDHGTALATPPMGKPAGVAVRIRDAVEPTTDHADAGDHVAIPAQAMNGCLA
jgi:hypothetical protein